MITFNKGCLVDFKGPVEFWNCVPKNKSNNQNKNEVDVDLPKCINPINQCQDKVLEIKKYRNSSEAIIGEGNFGGYCIVGLLYSENGRCLFLPFRISSSLNMMRYIFVSDLKYNLAQSMLGIPRLHYINEIAPKISISKKNCRSFIIFAETKINGQDAGSKHLKASIDWSLRSINIDILNKRPAFPTPEEVNYSCFQGLLPNIGAHAFGNPFNSPLIIPVS